MEKKVTEQSIFEEKTLVIEVVGDIAILREARVGMPPKVVCSGTKDIVATQVAAILQLSRVRTRHKVAPHSLINAE